MYQRRGFTLIELLTVISILMLLSSITIANLHAARISARNAQRLSEVRTILTALQMYYLDYGEFPNYPDLNTPDNLYPNGSQICQPYEVAQSGYGMICTSNRTCRVCGGINCDGDVSWLPPLDKTTNYFAPSAPRDPSTHSLCPANQLAYTYVAETGASVTGGSRSVIIYYLEEPMPSSFLGAQQFCIGSPRACQFQIHLRADGSIQ